MTFSWTSKEPIKGLRHFVLLNQFIENEKELFELVSVIDDEINMLITREELENPLKWEKGWRDLKKSESITNAYMDFKKTKKEKSTKAIFIKDDSKFHIS